MNANVLTPAKLRAIRSLRAMTQAELAAQSGVSQVAIATFETGKSDMRASNIVKLCEALGVKVTYTVDGSEISGP